LASELDVPLGVQLPIESVVSAVLALRRRKGMVLDSTDPDTRSAGSVFLSSVVEPDQAARLRREGASVHTYPDGHTRVSASWLLREAGFKLGESLGEGVAVSSKQYTLIAKDGATARSFARAVEVMRNRVRDVVGILLSPEPDLIGDEHVYAKLTESRFTEIVGR